MQSFRQHAHENAPRLDYEPVTPGRRMSERLKRLSLIVFYVAAATFAAALLWRFARQIQYVHRQTQAMSHAASPDTVVWTTNGPAASQPQAVFRLCDLTPNSAAIAFSHRRRNAQGQDRLVICFVYRDHGTPPLESIAASAGAPATLMPGSRFTRSEDTRSAHIWSAFDKVFAGQPDPNDQSRFTIACERKGKPITIEGRLADDDTVILTERADQVP